MQCRVTLDWVAVFMEFSIDLRHLARWYVSNLSYAATKWYFVLACLCLALISYLYYYGKSQGFSLRSFFRFIVPKSVYLHRSALLELRYLLTFPFIGRMIFGPALIFSGSGVAYAYTQNLLATYVGDLNYNVALSRPFLVIAIFTVISVLITDFVFYFHHYLQHRIPFLWEFHKVHHSAEVLTPMTDYRSHPLEFLTMPSPMSAALGFFQGCFAFFLKSEVEVYKVMGLNVILFGHHLSGYILRHTHIWVSYGPILERIFISPAQHQIHHSIAKRHHDKNLGGIFAIWDGLFGTLYVPKEKEDIVFGLSNDEHREFRSLWDMYVRPFRRNCRSLTGAAAVAILLGLFGYALALKLIASWDMYMETARTSILG